MSTIDNPWGRWVIVITAVHDDIDTSIKMGVKDSIEDFDD